jgi:hypothetical protein
MKNISSRKSLLPECLEGSSLPHLNETAERSEYNVSGEGQGYEILDSKKQYTSHYDLHYSGAYEYPGKCQRFFYNTDHNQYR